MQGPLRLSGSFWDSFLGVLLGRVNPDGDMPYAFVRVGRIDRCVGARWSRRIQPAWCLTSESPPTCRMDMDRQNEHWHVALTCSMDTHHGHGHAASKCPFCISMSILHIHAHPACPCPCCMSLLYSITDKRTYYLIKLCYRKNLHDNTIPQRICCRINCTTERTCYMIELHKREPALW
jgi:hypothetical protein